MQAPNRLSLAQKALCNLRKTKKSCNIAEFEELRDAAIKCFSLAYDAFFVFLHAYLQEVEKINIQGVVSPRSTFRYALQSGKIVDDEYKLCIDMIEDRNRTSHTYNEETAQEIFKQLAKYHKFRFSLLERFSD